MTKISLGDESEEEVEIINFPHFSFLANSRMPTTMLVCRESYHISSYLYNRVAASWAGWRMDMWCPPMFFNFHSDTLYLTSNCERCPWGVGLFRNAIRGINKDRQLLNAENLAISIDFRYDGSLEEWIADTQETFRKAKAVTIIVGEWGFEGKYVSCHGKPRLDLEFIDLDKVLKALDIYEDNRHHGVKKFKKTLSKYSLGVDQRRIHKFILKTQRVEEEEFKLSKGVFGPVIMELPSVSVKVAVTPQLKQRLKWIQEKHGRWNKQRERRLPR
jgi:hypothetical protein